jgi:hypothetical protein
MLGDLARGDLHRLALALGAGLSAAEVLLGRHSFDGSEVTARAFWDLAGRASHDAQLQAARGVRHYMVARRHIELPYLEPVEAPARAEAYVNYSRHADLLIPRLLLGTTLSEVEGSSPRHDLLASLPRISQP